MTNVGWGVLGAGWIVNQAMAGAIHNADNARLVAVGARELQRARAVEPERAYDSYQAVIEDPSVDVVYIALANDAHLTWIQAAIAAGKHVVCEKPMVLSATEAELVIAEAESAGVLLVEAAWTRWHPRIQRIVNLAVSGDLGEITTFLGSFTFTGVPTVNYRHSRTRGGGALYDVGVYPLHLLIGCLPEESVPTPTDVGVDHARGIAADLTIDLTTKATLTWSPESRASVMASFVMPESQRLEIRGSTTSVRVLDDQAYTSWRAATELVIGERVERFPIVDAYQLMVENVSMRIREKDAWLLPLRDTLRVAQTVDAIRMSIAF